MSLRIKLALSGSLLLTVALGLMTLHTLRTLRTQFEAAQQARVVQLRPLLNAALAVPMLQRDYASVQAILMESLQDPAIRAIRAYDSAGRQIASARAPSSPAEDPQAAEALTELQADLALEGQKLGSVQFSLSSRDLATAQARLTRYVLGIGSLILGLFSAVLWVLSGTVTRRLRQLADASLSIRQGQYAPALPAPSGDEVGLLVQAFATMGDEIRRRVDQLQVLNDGLEQQVSQRTRDLTQRTVELDQSVRALQTKTVLLNRAPFAMLVLDAANPGFPIIDTTDAIHQVFGHDPPTLVGRPIEVIDPEGAAGILARQLATLGEDARPLEWEAQVRAGAGERRWARCLAFPLRGGADEPLRTVLCLADIQELWQSREDQRRLAGELLESSRLKSVGLAIAGIAHDLNTPIGIAYTASTKMRGVVDQLSRDVTEGAASPTDAIPVPANRLQVLRRASELIAGNLSKAASLVSGLKTTTANATRSDWHKVALAPLFEALLVTLSPITQRARCEVRLTCPAGLALYTDPGAISQVITNLVVNATVHAFEGRSRREIRIDVTQRDAQVVIGVSDDGNGMQPEAAARAFTPFFTTRRDAGGSGLGLFSARRVVEDVLEGSIAMRSVPGEGTAFEVVLPIRDVRPGRTLSPRSGPSDQSRNAPA